MAELLLVVFTLIASFLVSLFDGNSSMQISPDDYDLLFSFFSSISARV